MTDFKIGSSHIYILEKPYLSSRITRWKVLLAEYDIIYMTRKVVKESAIPYHLADNTIKDYEPFNFDFLDEDVLVVEKEELHWWTMYFDEAVKINGNGAPAVIISLNNEQYLVLIKLQFECTNNMTGYEACILRLEVVLKLKIKKLDVYEDSILVIC